MRAEQSEKRFENVEVCSTLGIACLLDPRYKDRPFWSSNAKSVIKAKP